MLNSLYCRILVDCDQVDSEPLFLRTLTIDYTTNYVDPYACMVKNKRHFMIMNRS